MCHIDTYYFFLSQRERNNMPIYVLNISFFNLVIANNSRFQGTQEAEINCMYLLNFGKNCQRNLRMSKWRCEKQCVGASEAVWTGGATNVQACEEGCLISLRKTSLGRKSATENSTIVYHSPQSQIQWKVFVYLLSGIFHTFAIDQWRKPQLWAGSLRSFRKEPVDLASPPRGKAPDHIKPEWCWLPLAPHS